MIKKALLDGVKIKDVTIKAKMTCLHAVKTVTNSYASCVLENIILHIDLKMHQHIFL